jgi:hypothetical protein
MKQLNKTAYNFSVSLILIPFIIIVNFLNKKRKQSYWQFSFIKNTLKTFCEVFVIEFYLKLKLILRIITYLTYICCEIDNFVIKSDILRRFFICKNILIKLSCYHDNYFRYFMFGKYNGFVSKARVFCIF